MTETYKKALVNNATKLDAVTESGGEITKLAVSITEQNDRGLQYLFCRKSLTLFIVKIVALK